MSYTHLLYHIVFATKDRVRLISPAWEDELYRYLGGIVKNHGGEPIEINGMPEHGHLLVRLKQLSSLTPVLRNGVSDITRNLAGSGATARLPSASLCPKPCENTYRIRNCTTKNRRSRTSLRSCSVCIMSNTTRNIYGIDHACFTRWLISSIVFYRFRSAPPVAKVMIACVARSRERRKL